MHPSPCIAGLFLSGGGQKLSGGEKSEFIFTEAREGSEGVVAYSDSPADGLCEVHDSLRALCPRGLDKCSPWHSRKGRKMARRFCLVHLTGGLIVWQTGAGNERLT